MGMYVNPGNRAFAEIADSDYVDQTGLIALINGTINRKNKLTCVSRPRRFGKSWAVRMLTAYYDGTCDSHLLFDQRAIAEDSTYREYMNQFNVICLDISGFISDTKKTHGNLRDIPALIEQAIWKDLTAQGFQPKKDDNLRDFLLRCVEQKEKRRFIFIIDEWDAMIREAKNDDAAQEAYLNLLRSWFKNTNFTPEVVAAAYMTGILPIKKDGSQSAISDFREFSMLHPGKFAPFTGFRENDVKALCERNNLSFDEVRAWYDGYDFDRVGAIYNPYSVMCAMEERNCRSYWRKTSASESLESYIDMDFDGLQTTIARLITGERMPVNPDGFQNDFERFGGKDDVLTLLVHLGYLTWHETDQTVQIPNEEVRLEFKQFLNRQKISPAWLKMIQRSKNVLDDTIAGKSAEVAAVLEEIREEQYAPQYYNNEQALRAVVKYAYIVAFGQYIRAEEMPAGKGVADLVFIPGTLSQLPAMIIELKWNKTSETALQQIKDKRYQAILKPYAGRLLLVGINYDEKTGRHSCAIEKA